MPTPCPVCEVAAAYDRPKPLDGEVVTCRSPTCGRYIISGSAIETFKSKPKEVRLKLLASAKAAAPHGEPPKLDA